MWRQLAAVLMLVSTSSYADVLCNSGYYLDTQTNECTKCGEGKYYCPGDNIRYDCPSAADHMMTDWPAEYYNPTVIRFHIYDDHNEYLKVLDSATKCMLEYDLKNERGKLYSIRTYNPSTNLYDTHTSSWGWTDANPGYYLTNPKACWSGAYYYNVELCPPGAYCPGQPAHWGCTNYTQLNDFGLFVCSDNSYSDAGASACTPCPDGTGNTGDDISAHAGISSCLPLCSHGATKLHIAENIFNIWPSDKCTSPSLRISINDNICCINMKPAAGKGINIEFKDNIYHTTN